ncbi:hypothetical protein EC968_003265 [Mortierella alpina]|nr:hypothetical protein EC968_003265 [Mortierella alpina]
MASDLICFGSENAEAFKRRGHELWCPGNGLAYWTVAKTYGDPYARLVASAFGRACGQEYGASERHRLLRSETSSPLPEAPQSPTLIDLPSSTPSSTASAPTEIHLVINFRKGEPKTVSRSTINVPAALEVDYLVGIDSLEVITVRINAKLSGQDKVIWTDPGRPYIRPSHSSKHSSFVEASRNNFEALLLKAWRKEMKRLMDASMVKVHLFVYLTDTTAATSAERLHQATFKRKALGKEAIDADDADDADVSYGAKRPRPQDGYRSSTSPQEEASQQAQDAGSTAEDHHHSQQQQQAREGRRPKFRSVRVKFDGVLHLDASDLLRAVNLPPNFNLARLFDFDDSVNSLLYNQPLRTAPDPVQGRPCSRAIAPPSRQQHIPPSMAKRTHPEIQPRPLYPVLRAAPSTIPNLAVSTQTAAAYAMTAAASTSIAGPTPTSPSSFTPSASTPPPTTPKWKNKFWIQPGMNHFVNWLTHTGNYARLNKEGTVQGGMVVEIFDQIAKFINAATADSENKTSWTPSTVKQKCQYIKLRYREAKALELATTEGEDGSLRVRARILELCPYFDRLDAVMGASQSRNQPPIDEGARIIVESSEESDSESDMESTSLSEIDDTEAEHHTETSNGRATKRTKHAKHIGYAELRATLHRLNNNAPTRGVRTPEQDEIWADIRRRELRLEQRESEWLHKQEMISEVIQKEFDASLLRRQEIFDREKAEFYEAKLEFKKEVADFKAELADFKAERDELFRELTHLKALESIHTAIHTARR